jgi:drug/metabolite transporter (DMT)-like permease
MSLEIHLKQRSIPASEVTFFRAICLTLCLFPFVVAKTKELVSKQAMPLWARSLCGAISSFCFTWNLQHTAVGSAYMFFNLAPLVLLTTALIFKGERITSRIVVCLTVVVMGSTLYWSHSTAPVSLQVALVGVTGAVLAACAYTALKLASTNWSAVILAWAISLASIPVALLFRNDSWLPVRGAVLMDLLLITSLGMIGQILVGLSYRWIELSAATALVLSNMAWSSVLDYISGYQVRTLQLVGCLVYVAGMLPLLLRQRRGADWVGGPGLDDRSEPL